MLLGIVFLNQGLCQAAIIKVFGLSFNFFLPRQLILFSSGFLILTGTICKIWATYLVGLDIYYYKDLFLNRITRVVEVEPYVKSGPYKYLSNPMYGVGNLQAYGAAIWFLSWPGLVIAAVFQISIYVFYFFIERPFIHNTYLKPVVVNE
jgi:protein-S-isoprenylcysteine O-methyltransferase Ste14